MVAEIDSLVSTWIKRCQIIETEGDESPSAQNCFWAYEKLDDICWNDPKMALKIILEIVNETNAEFVLDNLAAGPLESLLARHGDKVIYLVESEAQKNSKFRELIQGVWRNTISDDVWIRLKKLHNV